MSSRRPHLHHTHQTLNLSCFSGLLFHTCLSLFLLRELLKFHLYPKKTIFNFSSFPFNLLFFSISPPAPFIATPPTLLLSKKKQGDPNLIHCATGEIYCHQ
eukprot:TRINITY_DN13417_c0_g1_i1.p1 TRINITY_DN13417_c0_g1~~TRINITY_DN13417_c0_g1_i1.p1  ORF type:complete len:101 (-),score=9.96 TRINITY_DN13417_c0_g1_i1:57-359(-)